MLDVFFLVAFALLPIAIWWVSRSIVLLTVGLILGFGLAGNLVQTLIAMGFGLNVRILQGLALVVMVALLVIAIRVQVDTRGARRLQLETVWLPFIVFGLGLVMLRLAAPEDPGPLSAIGYLMNHPLAEDNAKWLHLAAQISDGRTIEFNGYAGGPLLLMMAAFSSLVSVLSLLFLGGINEVAVAANSVLAVQFFLVAVTPFALAPFTLRHKDQPNSRTLPPPVLWMSAVFLALTSAVVTSYGHLSQQFTIIVLTFWVACFLVRAPRWTLLASSLAVVTTVSVWVPLNVLGLIILLVAIAVTVRSRWWAGLAVTVVTFSVAFDAVVSSITYVLGIQVRLPNFGGSGVASDVEATAELVGLAPPAPGELVASAHLFRAPGATEQPTALLAILAVAVVLATAWILVKRSGQPSESSPWIWTPLAALLGYTLLLTIGDALITGSSPNYGATKLAFTVIVVAIAAGLPFALIAADPDVQGMSLLRWIGLASVVAILLFDSLLPRAISALSPLLWKGVDAAAPVFWSAAEVRDSGDQPLQGNPIACLFSPPESELPSALPLGQESYSCTRLLTGLAGLEGDASRIGDWLLTDWQSQSTNWNEFRDSIAQLDPDVLDRSVILMNEGGGLAGLTTLRELVERN